MEPVDSDCVVVGASFAGLACATALARAGMRVIVLEKKSDAGEKLRTTGIIVKDVIDQITLLDGLPAEIVHCVTGVRLYAPNLEFIDLQAPGYYFLSTDTPAVMRWLAAKEAWGGGRIRDRGVPEMWSGRSLSIIGPDLSQVSNQAPASIPVRSISERHDLQPYAADSSDP